MCLVLLLALLAVAASALPALGWASPPDPSWIAGIYDEADGDDIAALVSSASGIGNPAPAGAAAPPAPSIGTIASLSERPVVAAAASPTRPRAPPAA